MVYRYRFLRADPKRPLIGDMAELPKSPFWVTCPTCRSGPGNACDPLGMHLTRLYRFSAIQLDPESFSRKKP